MTTHPFSSALGMCRQLSWGMDAFLLGNLLERRQGLVKEPIPSRQETENRKCCETGVLHSDRKTVCVTVHIFIIHLFWGKVWFCFVIVDEPICHFRFWIIERVPKSKLGTGCKFSSTVNVGWLHKRTQKVYQLTWRQGWHEDTTHTRIFPQQTNTDNGGLLFPPI